MTSTRSDTVQDVSALGETVESNWYSSKLRDTNEQLMSSLLIEIVTTPYAPKHSRNCIPRMVGY